MNRAVPSNSPVRTGRASRTATPSEAVVKLRRIFELELRRGCDDGAVIGGLDRFLSIAKQDKGVVALLAKASPVAKGYASMSPAARERWLREVLGARANEQTSKRAKTEAGEPSSAERGNRAIGQSG